MLVRGDRVYGLEGPATVLGRSRQCDVVVNDPNVSRRHAEVRREADGYVVVDLDSTNGILVNGQGVKRAALADGDRLQLGTTSPALRDPAVLDTVLFVLKIVFLVLLFLFVFFVVRRTVRDVRGGAARPAPRATQAGRGRPAAGRGGGTQRARRPRPPNAASAARSATPIAPCPASRSTSWPTSTRVSWSRRAR